MQLNTFSPTPSMPVAVAVDAFAEPHSGELSLGELVELVACMVPEQEVADTVEALFERGFASFSRPLGADERAALQAARVQ